MTFARPFALGRYPATFAEYDHLCAATGRQKPRDWDWGRGRRPVIEVSWEDAQAYCDWLSEVTRRTYRLPSEAEWEYACRAGTATLFWIGDTIRADQANFAGPSIHGGNVFEAEVYEAGVFERTISEVAADGQHSGQTSAVDTFPANPWGLHDMHGNVWEWCADRWHPSYDGAPSDGLAWLEGKQSVRVVRGGSWIVGPEKLRSAYRDWIVPGSRFDVLGFRVARTRTPGGVACLPSGAWSEAPVRAPSVRSRRRCGRSRPGARR